MPENLLQKFLEYESPRATQIYYRRSRMAVKRTFKVAMQKNHSFRREKYFLQCSFGNFDFAFFKRSEEIAIL